MKQVWSGAIGRKPDMDALAKEIGNPPMYCFVPRYMISGGMKELFGSYSLTNPFEISIPWELFADLLGDTDYRINKSAFSDPIRNGVNRGNNLVGMYFVEYDGLLRGSVSVVSKAETKWGSHLIALSKPHTIPLTPHEKKQLEKIDGYRSHARTQLEVIGSHKSRISREAFNKLSGNDKDGLLIALLASTPSGAVIEDVTPIGNVTGYEEAVKAAEYNRVPVSDIGERFKELEAELAELKTAYKTDFPDVVMFNGTLPERLKGTIPSEFGTRRERILARLGSEAFIRELRSQKLAAPVLL